MRASLPLALLCSGLALAQSNTSTSSVTLPTVDLGYQVQQASGFNETGRYYNFSNIRYGAPPVGDLRFAHPQPPMPNRTAIQSGLDARICPQATPTWAAIAEQVVPKYLINETVFNSSSFVQPNLTFPAQDPTTNEDCLFLDVFVPEDIWDQVASGKKFPVLFWIYGGGFTFGSKVSSGSPAGILAASQNNSNPGVIYVAPNYRLGAFGWLSGPTFQGSGGLANAGLYDQRLALQWVQKHIHKFGGDKHRVTVFGESAGGSSILHQITAFGGHKGPANFNQAVLQSPAFQVIPSTNQQETVYQGFLAAANVSTLAEARNLTYTELQAANVLTVQTAAYGTFTYGPVVDGVITPSIPGQLLARGQFDHRVSIMLGQNADEGLEFTSPFAGTTNDTLLAEILYASIPTLAGLPAEVEYITNTLYPPIYNGSQAYGYTNTIQRAAAITTDFGFICNTFYLDKAFNNNTYSYLFDVYPALHGEDVPYTYYSGPNTTESQVARELQAYITTFAETGSPNGGDGVPYFKMYGPTAQVLELQSSAVAEVIDPAANQRCDYWQSGVWF